MQSLTEILEVTSDTLETYEGPVNRDQFEKWVDANDLREWVSDTVRHGEHYQTAGVYSWEEYYDGGGAEYDLYNFLSVREPATGKLRTLPDMQASLNKLKMML